jgi:class 3 adenylate cyclase/tetratricopeptide (TPR) repeat protein
VAEGGQTAGTATILFTDLVGSTEMRARLGDAVADELRRAHDHLLTAAVDDHSGTLVKSLGDGILATFGAAAEAVAAATAMQRAIERANRRVDDARRLAVRVGISAGDVSLEEGDVHGTPVVTAARLCDRAVGGQILVDDLVRGLARGRTEHSFRLVGELDLKGLGEPVTAYEVPWEPVVGDRAPLPAPLLPVANELPFAGRDDEREALRVQWKSAQTDGRTVALVSGEPGVGKTRLTAELARAAHSDGAWVLAGRCDEGIAAPFAPWLEILRQVLAHAPDEILFAHVERHGGELTRLVPELGRRVDDVPEPRALDPETEQLALFGAVVDLLDALALDAPVLLVIDDAHWADASSLGLLRHSVRHLPPTAALFAVVTYRDTDVDRGHPLSAMIGDFRREPRVEHLSLRGIDEAGIRALLTAAGGAELDELGRQFAATLERETEGNPFFVGEVLRHLVETNVIVHQDGAWRGAVLSIDEVGIPEGVRDVVGRRLSRLSEDANTTLRTAAVVGREFQIDVVAEVMDRSEDAVLADVELAIAASLVNEVQRSPGRMSFSHALVQSTLIEELSTTRRVRLHAAIGEALERRGDASEAELAHHFAEAAATGMADKAVEHACRAAVEAKRRLAYDEVVHFYDLAIEALEAADADDEVRARLLIDRGYAHHERGDPESGKRDALAAADAARTIGDAALLGMAGVAYMGLVGQWASPADPIAVDLMREGLAGAVDGDERMRSLILSSLAAALAAAPGDEALGLAQEAVRLATVAGDDEALLRAYNSWTWALRSAGDPGELLRVAQIGVERAVAVGMPQWEFGLRYQAGEAYVESGDLDDAAAEFARAGSVPSVLQGWAPVVFAASLALAQGQLDAAEPLIEQAAGLGTALGDTNDVISFGQLITLNMSRGRLDEVMELCDREEQILLGLALGYRMFALAEAGELERATDVHTEWARTVRPLIPLVVKPWACDAETSVVYRTGDASRAPSLRTEVDRWRGLMLGGDTGLLGSGDYLVGRIAAVEGRLDDAVGALTSAIEFTDSRGLHRLTTGRRVDLARALFARDEPGDADRAAKLLQQAIEVADALGLVAAGNDARSLLG